MTIDRSALERELASVRQQQQQFVRLVEQTSGAEKVLLGLLGLLDKMEAAIPAAPEDTTAASLAPDGPTIADAIRAKNDSYRRMLDALHNTPDEAVKAAIEGMTVTDPDEEIEPTDYDLGRYEREAVQGSHPFQNANGTVGRITSKGGVDALSYEVSDRVVMRHENIKNGAAQ